MWNFGRGHLLNEPERQDKTDKRVNTTNSGVGRVYFPLT